MNTGNLRSCLAPQIESFIRLRRLSGSDYHGQALLLECFDRFLIEQKWNEPCVSPELTDRYQHSLALLAPRTRSNRLCVVRQFCAYLAQTNPLSYVPERPRMMASYGAHSPYIFSPREVQALMSAASHLPPPGSLRPHTYRTLLGLLYSTGIRIGEAFALNLKDVFVNDQKLYIAEGKFRKSRWIALSVSTCQAVQQYLAKRLQKIPRSPNSPLFLNERAQRLRHPAIHQTFMRLLRTCDIAHTQQTGPRIHDLRHTFAVHRLLAWYRDGQDVNARLPALATYLGHVDVSSTQVYLRPTAELLEAVHHRFHDHYIHTVDHLGGKL